MIIKKIAELTEEDLARVNENSILAELEAWDSLAMVSFLVFASSEYGVEIVGSDLRNAVTVSDLYKLIQDKKNDDKN